MDDKELYYDLAKFEANMIATRSNFLLVFQSMLFAAVTNISNPAATFIPLWLMLSLGFLTSVVWLYLNVLTNQIFKAAMNKVKKEDERMEALLKESRQGNFLLEKGKVSSLMTYPFPVLTGTVWVILLCKYCCE